MLEKEFAEVYQVIKHMDKKDTNKISPDFLKMIEDNMDLSCGFTYDENKKVYEQNLSPNARVIISIIYIKYLATEEEKDFYYGKLLEDKKLDQLQFSRENMFKNNRKTVNTASADQEKIEVQNLDLVEKKEKWYMKIINWIRRKKRRVGK